MLVHEFNFWDNRWHLYYPYGTMEFSRTPTATNISALTGLFLGHTGQGFSLTFAVTDISALLGYLFYKIFLCVVSIIWDILKNL